jgi:hypothetical protein
MKHRLSSAPPAGLDTWGLDPIDYRLNQDLTLIRRYPSPLTHFGLGSRAQKQKKVMKRKTKIFHIKLPFVSLVIYCRTSSIQSHYSAD